MPGISFAPGIIMAKRCKGCGKNLTKANAYQATLRFRGKIYKVLRARCTKCHNRHEGKLYPVPLVVRALYRYRRRSRQTGDKCDLDTSFINIAFDSACTYCTRHGQPMTLDRKDPLKGYLKENVVPACALCNRLKSDLPYIVWMRLVPLLKEAIFQGELETCHANS
jgi:hypothetical protein